MWPFARGSIQPLKAPKEICRPKSPSAPQLTPAVEKEPMSRLSFFPEPDNSLQPGLCLHRLFSPDQLIKFSALSTDDTMSTMISCMPESVPTQHAQPLAVLLYSVYRWALTKKFDINSTSVLLTLYFQTYRYCVETPWRTQAELYSFFKESLLRSSVHHSPQSERVLVPEHCKACLLQFCRSFLTTLPLMRLISLPNYRLHLHWDLPIEEQQINSKTL